MTTGNSRRVEAVGADRTPHFCGCSLPLQFLVSGDTRVTITKNWGGELIRENRTDCEDGEVVLYINHIGRKSRTPEQVRLRTDVTMKDYGLNKRVPRIL